MLEHLKEAARDWLGPSEKPEKRHLNDLALEYSARELSSATEGFCPKNRLGSGAAGAVYRGVLRGGTEVAVKVLTGGGSNGFEDEVRVLSRFRHPNVVTLLGWGVADHERYLVYELLTGGDVSKKLEKCRRDGAPFTWQERLRVAHDSACGLSHMVNSDEKAFHRDIKPANILLDAGGAAKMADFGLASIIHEMGRQHLTVENISGTPGYACPMYIQTGQVSEKSEIYSFGIVLLELLINQPPALAGPQGDIIYPLLQTVQPSAPGAHGRVLAALDPRAQWPRQVVDDFAGLALDMVDMRSERRPAFVTVVRDLRHLVNTTGPRAPPGQMPAPYPGPGGYGGGPPGAPYPPGGPGMPGMPGASGRPVLPPPPPGAGPAGGMYGPGGGYGGSTPAAGDQRRSSAENPATLLAEVVLEAVAAEGIELGALPPDRKCIAFPVDPSRGRLSCQVGRQHQPDFFERLVCKKDSLSSISRSHFELAWEPPASAPTLRKLSGNPLLLDDHAMTPSEAPTVPDGARIGFCGTSEGAPRFLVLRVTLRSRGAVAAEGAHPAVMLSLQKRNSGYANAGASLSQAPTMRSGSAVVAVLECTGSIGGDPAKLPSDQRIIPIPMEETVEIGRQHQNPYFYEQLLQADAKWLSFISRTHCRVSLQRVGDGPATSPSSYALRVENLSSNALLVNGKSLPKGNRDSITEGGKIVFVANAGEGDTEFLKFKLRRARGVG